MLNSLHLWLDANIELNLSREAVEMVELALRGKLPQTCAPGDNWPAELATAANIIRAHLQHLPPKGIPLHAIDPLLG